MALGKGGGWCSRFRGWGTSGAGGKYLWGGGEKGVGYFREVFAGPGGGVSRKGTKGATGACGEKGGGGVGKGGGKGRGWAA